MGDAGGRARAFAAVAVVCVGLATTSVSSAAQPPLERSTPPAVAAAAGPDEFELDRLARVQRRDVPSPLPEPEVSEDDSVPEDFSVVEPIDD
ncbi:MAG TPA: hypothetical protein VFR46_06325, partial [Actinomycetes bacterium]|nr:hypothetical protein [Actinomycetes bacterium]